MMFEVIGKERRLVSICQRNTIFIVVIGDRTKWEEASNFLSAGWIGSTLGRHARRDEEKVKIYVFCVSSCCASDRGARPELSDDRSAPLFLGRTRTDRSTFHPKRSQITTVTQSDVPKKAHRLQPSRTISRREVEMGCNRLSHAHYERRRGGVNTARALVRIRLRIARIQHGQMSKEVRRR